MAKQLLSITERVYFFVLVDPGFIPHTFNFRHPFILANSMENNKDCGIWLENCLIHTI